MQDQGIAADEGEPDETTGWSQSMPVSTPRARRSDRSAAVDEWLRRHMRRLLDQVGALPAPVFLRERTAVAARRPAGSGDVVRHADRTKQAVAAVVFFLLVLCLALTTWQWNAARTDAVAARAQSERTAATRDFLEQMLRAAGTSATEDEGRARTKALLDGATPRIAQQFASDPRAQVELLDLVASMYRDIGEFDSRRALLALQRVQLQRVYGATHPIVIRSLLDEAQAEISRRDLDAANARLTEADPLISRAGLDDDAIRARWWMLRGDAQRDARAGIDALDRAIATFQRQRPPDARLAEAIRRKAWRVLPTRPVQAEALFQRVVSLSQVPERRRDALTGLARAREEQGEYEASLQALGEAHALAGKDGPVEDARFAWTLHRDGQRDRAREVFEVLMPRLSSGKTDEVAARAYYGEALTAEGRPMQAIPLLETAIARDGGIPDRQRALLALGDAYDRAGIWTKARDTLKASLDQRLQRGDANTAGVAEARERWGRFLLDRGDFEGAQAQFDEVLDQAGDRNVERAVLAYGGLARLALHREDWDAALTASTHAVVGFENIVGPRDVRSGPYLWLIHAEALRRVHDFASARIWTTRALDASRRYDAPDAASIKEAEAVMARLLG